MSATDAMLFPFPVAVKQIKDGLDWLYRSAEDARGRYERAGNAGAELAQEVYRFIEDPEGVGMDMLREACERFMGQHSAGFYD